MFGNDNSLLFYRFCKPFLRLLKLFFNFQQLVYSPLLRVKFGQLDGFGQHFSHGHPERSHQVVLCLFLLDFPLPFHPLLQIALFPTLGVVFLLIWPLCCWLADLLGKGDDPRGTISGPTAPFPLTLLSLTAMPATAIVRGIVIRL